MMDKYKKQNRLSIALAFRGMRQSELCEKTGIKKASINGWCKNNWQPKQEALYKMAKVLNVSEMWLAGYDVPMDRIERGAEYVVTTKDNIELLVETEKYKDIVNKLPKLTDDQLNTIIALINQFYDLNNKE